MGFTKPIASLDKYDFSKLHITKTKSGKGNSTIFYLGYGDWSEEQPFQTPMLPTSFNVEVKPPTMGPRVWSNACLSLEGFDTSKPKKNFVDFVRGLEERCKQLVLETAEGKRLPSLSSAIKEDESGQYPPNFSAMVNVWSTDGKSDDMTQMDDRKFMQLGIYDVHGTKLDDKSIPWGTSTSLIVVPKYAVKVSHSFSVKLIATQAMIVPRVMDMSEAPNMFVTTPEVEEAKANYQPPANGPEFATPEETEDDDVNWSVAEQTTEDDEGPLQRFAKVRKVGNASGGN